MPNIGWCGHASINKKAREKALREWMSWSDDAGMRSSRRCGLHPAIRYKSLRHSTHRHGKRHRKFAIATGVDNDDDDFQPSQPDGGWPKIWRQRPGVRSDEKVFDLLKNNRNKIVNSQFYNGNTKTTTSWNDLAYYIWNSTKILPVIWLENNRRH